MQKLIYLGALAFIVIPGAAGADWRTPIQGAEPILATRFTPMRYEVTGPLAVASLDLSDRQDGLPAEPAAVGWSSGSVAWAPPLVDRRLTSTERAADLAPDLIDAISRIEPMYDPTRIDGAETPREMVVSAGTAAMNNVFADHWRRASPDPDINVKTRYLADVWEMTGPRPCDAFSKRRPHAANEPALDALSPSDCRELQRYEALRFDEVPTPVIAAAAVSVPIFAAPLPGSRMPSDDFWARQKTRVEAIEASLHQKWRAGEAQALVATLVTLPAATKALTPIPVQATIPLTAHIVAKAQADAKAKAATNARAVAPRPILLAEAPEGIHVEAKARGAVRSPTQADVRARSLAPTLAKAPALALAHDASETDIRTADRPVRVSDLGLRP